MESQFVVPARNYLNKVIGPETWQLFRYRPIDNEYLTRLSKSKLRLFRNYFFAINGYKFNSQDLFDYYSRYDWYKPVENFNESRINYVERLNINSIQIEEQRR